MGRLVQQDVDAVDFLVSRHLINLKTPMRPAIRDSAAGDEERRRRDPHAVSGGVTASPFAQSKQPAPSPSPFGAPSQQNSPFAGFGKASPVSFGAPSGLEGTAVNNAMGFHSQQPQQPKPSNGATGSSVPVEDSSLLGSYTERYEQLKLDRTKQREKAIREGQMADPNQPTSLNRAITPVGTCTSMCPEFERVERIVQKMVDKSEKFLHPTTNTLQNMEMKMLKRFRRSAAGYDEQLPSDIRTPKTLLQTMNYLIRHVINGPEPLGLIHKFVWDRTRSIRNDFSVQQVTQEEDVKIAVTCLERIARFHIVSLHLLSSPANEEPFDRHQEREQLNNTMLSLMYYYDDNRGRISFPNEDELRAYYIIFSIHDQRPDLEARVQKWPAELRNSPRVQIALELFAAASNTWEYQGTLDAKRPNAIAQGFYARFFSMIDSPGVSYLMACVAEIYFNHMRQTAIRSIWKGYCRYPSSQQHKNEEWIVDELTKVLCFDDYEQTMKFCEEQDLGFAENASGESYLNWGSRPVDSVAFQPSSDHSFSENHVESKRAGRTLAAVILGLNIKEAANLGMIDSSLLSERLPALPAPVSSTNDDSLFVSDDENVISSNVQTAKAPSQDESPQESPTFSSSLPNPFANFSQPATNTSDRPATLFPQPPASTPSFGTISNAFSSFFPSNSATGAPPTPATATANPFANIKSPFTSSKSPGSQDSSTPFPPAPIPQQSPSIFAAPPKPTTKPEEKAPLFTPTPFKFPSAFQATTAPTSPSTAAFFSFDSEPEQINALTAGQPAPSIFDTVITPFSSGTSGSIFSFPQSTTSGDAATPQPQETSSQPFGEAPSQPASIFSPKPTPKENEKPPLFFSPSPPVQSDTTPEGQFGITNPNENRPIRLEDQDSSAVPLQKTPLKSSPKKDNIPPHNDSIIGQPDISSQETVLAQPPVDDKGSLQSINIETEPPSVATESPDENRCLLSAPDADSHRTAWLSSLREAAHKRRDTTSTSRKRVLEEPEEPVPVESAPKAPKVPKPQAPPPYKKSLAQASTKPLPKLPILEQIESMIARKPAEPTPEPQPKSIQVDEDEMLLSAARIAGESLRSGPRLLDNWSAPYEPRSSSFSPGGSASPSLAFSRSQSPHSSYVNGYEVSLAPDTDLGLGRTLSRTEQRIRLTGAKGLAYKPLDFIPDKKRKSR
ncbi:hypothetical protein BO71DRAFT_382043 [Aspergillus ellipticus CBS 707.79]|uniref:SAC3/GANP/THP3 conserved domain-containing protein n=1 Tax=Aspergillus ellipticus CBS 707.79 TaxID=1448320 RepID=A0A319D7J9_9EURO|nr:hypothetical protein BO71DRAFT_382043 [Aspergillus ellipticus CBS 707.79]